MYNAEAMPEVIDVVVIGGGAAGLSAALMLGRSRRSVVVIDAGQPRNAPAAAMHGFLGHDGLPPSELLARGRDEVARYGVRVVSGEVSAVSRDGDEFVVDSADLVRGLRTRRVLVTTGLVDELPDVPGLPERWGRDVLHCPYCHGWEVRDRKIGILATGPRSVHQALLFRQLSDDVVYVTNGRALSAEERGQLTARDVPVVDSVVTSVEVDGDRLVGLRLSDGTVVARDAIAVSTRMVARSTFLERLGLDLVEHPSGTGLHIPVDATGRTAVDGIWAAGNVTDLAAQVGGAAAAGASAAIQINADLVAEDTRRAVSSARGSNRDVRASA